MSIGAAVVTVTNCPIAWKSGRQSMATLFMMENELLKATQTAVLAEGIACLCDEFAGHRLERVLRVDNQVSTAMLQGGPGSRRTRHLKVLSAYIMEHVEGLLTSKFVEGQRQLVDLATKPHPKARLWELFSATAAQQDSIIVAGLDELLLSGCGGMLLGSSGNLGGCEVARRMHLEHRVVEEELERTWDKPREVLSGSSPHKQVKAWISSSMSRALSQAPLSRADEFI